MRRLKWKTLDWTGKNIVVGFDNETIGRLTFNNAWYSNAEYNSEQRKTKFNLIGFWSKTIEILHNGECVGYITLNLWGDQILKMKSGNVYHLSTNFIGRDIKWISPSGQTLIQYIQPSMTSSGRGTIEALEELPSVDKDILVSSGLFIKTLATLYLAMMGGLAGLLITRIIIR